MDTTTAGRLAERSQRQASLPPFPGPCPGPSGFSGLSGLSGSSPPPPIKQDASPILSNHMSISHNYLRRLYGHNMLPRHPFRNGMHLHTNLAQRPINCLPTALPYQARQAISPGFCALRLPRSNPKPSYIQFYRSVSALYYVDKNPTPFPPFLILQPHDSSCNKEPSSCFFYFVCFALGSRPPSIDCVLCSVSSTASTSDRLVVSAATTASSIPTQLNPRPQRHPSTQRIPFALTSSLINICNC